MGNLSRKIKLKNSSETGGIFMVNKIAEEELLALYHQGLTNREIADRLQVTPPSVQYRLGKLGLVNNYCKDPSVDVEQVKVLHGLGLTTIGIAFLLKSNVRAIAQCMKELGLTDNEYRLKEFINQCQTTEG
jgi:hypothetical protein